jgi:hypothetical protein
VKAQGLTSFSGKKKNKKSGLRTHSKKMGRNAKSLMSSKNFKIKYK